MASKKDVLIDTAGRLFDRDGFTATGIDRILAEAGVAKMTLYHHFGGKEALILAVIQRQDARFRAYFERGANAERAEAAGLLAIFDLIHEWCHAPGFNGCLFMKACAEFPDSAHPVHQAAAAHKRHLRDRMADLAQAAGYAGPGRLADQLMLLSEGAIIRAQTVGALDAARTARSTAAQILRAASP